MGGCFFCFNWGEGEGVAERDGRCVVAVDGLVEGWVEERDTEFVDCSGGEVIGSVGGWDFGNSGAEGF